MTDTSDQPGDPVTSATQRLTKEGATSGEDPREIDEERADRDQVAAEQHHRSIRHADQLSTPESQMGTTSTTDIDADDPLERDA